MQQTPSTEQIPGFYTNQHVKPECAPFALMEGHKQAMLFVHGLTGSPADFRQFTKTYANHYDVFTPLWPGHGSHISYLERLTYKELFIPFEPLMAWLQERYEKVHVTALSYGCILAADLVLRRSAATFTTLAPAFYLTVEQEKKMVWVKRFHIHKFRKRVSKSKVRSSFSSGDRDAYTYDDIATVPAVELHLRSAEIRPQLKDLEMPVFHAHGNADRTTPHHSNHAFLKQQIQDYIYHEFEDAGHVLPTEACADELTLLHLQWLEAHS